MLADKLDEINAAKLILISIDETQDELKSIAAAINGMLDRIHESCDRKYALYPTHPMSEDPISVIQGYKFLDRWGKDDEKTFRVYKSNKRRVCKYEGTY